MKLSDKDVELLKFKENDVVVKKVILSTGEYYAKYCNIYETFMELLGNKVFALIGIKCPTYHYIKEAHCVLSEDVKKYDTFYNPFDLNMNGYTLRNVKCKLCDSGLFFNMDEINFQIDVMHFIDILFSNIDRHISNFGFARREDGTGYLVVYDNADFLTQFDKATRPMSIDDADSLSFVFTSKEIEARDFIGKLSEEEILYLLKIYEMFSPIRLVTIIRSIEKENNIKLPDKLDVFKKYLKNYLMVGKLLKEKGKIHKK
jgi:hypothetical protein